VPACVPLLLALVLCPLCRVAAQTPATQGPTLTDEQSEAQAAADAAHAQQVQQLIAQAEADYNSGVANYNANHLDAARANFDAAVDLMLSSGMDLKNDPQLADDFDHLLSEINSLEMDALKQGNGFSPQVEAAPLDAPNEITFAANPALVSKVTAELKTTTSDLPLVVNEYVAGFISAFQGSRRGTLERSLERAGKYKDMIQKVLRDNGVPQDLIYQAVAESGFQPQALNSRSGAGGMWQFMPFAGAYGLERNGYFDERFDPEKSTIAYAKYMKSLYNQFDDWYLAMAAYDWGPGNVQRAVARTGYADFWELYRRGALPSETRNYVPGIIAAAIMAKNPQQYGLSDMVPDAPVLSDTITTSYAIDLRLVADLTNSTVPEIVALNPALLRLATPSDIPYDLHLPPGTKQVYLDRLKAIPEDHRDSWRFHVVKQGETLDDIATALHARAAQIATFNRVTDAEPIQAGDMLVVPVEAVSASPGQQRYTLRRGDTLVTVADRFGITVEQLREWNRLSSSRVSPGRSLYVVEPVRLAPGMHLSRRRRGAHASSKSTHSATTRKRGKKRGR
jgi:membrane-bound lytic murein transglycosylase D